ncbi:MAG: SAM-dependent methyltransferase [Roseateles sp.]|nr:MAG: SAM-dependent methyltransferase [Roseateles sp.]
MNSTSSNKIAAGGIDEAIDALHQATAYYTAEPIVDELLAELGWPAFDKRLVDPSCGDGAFLARAVDALLQAAPAVDDVKLTQLVHGWEIHAEAADAARTRLTEVLRAAGRSDRAAAATGRMMVTTGDFLTDAPLTPTWSICAGNPPFLRYAHLHPLLQQRYLAALPDYSRADMLHGFLDRCAKVLLPGGAIGIVASDRWLFNSNAARLREVLGETLGIAGLRRIDGASAFYRAKTRRAGTLPRVHPVALVLRARELCPQPLQALGRAPLYPGASSCAGTGRTLEDVATVRLAPWLGSKGVFVVDQATAATLPAEHLVPALDTDDILHAQDGTRYVREPTRRAIRTFRAVEPTGAVLDHLKANLHRMAKRGHRAAKFWVPPETFERFDLDVPHLLIPRIARDLQSARVPAGILPVNHNISIVSINGEAGLDEIEERLRDPRSVQWVRERAPALENGYFSVTTTLLRQLPLF